MTSGTTGSRGTTGYASTTGGAETTDGTATTSGPSTTGSAATTGATTGTTGTTGRGTTTSGGGTTATTGDGGATGRGTTGTTGRTGSTGDAGTARGTGTTGGTGSTGGVGGSSDGGASGGFDPCPTNGDPCKILPLGDSITFGIQYAGAYRVELFTKAVGASKKITFVGSQMNGPTTAAGMPFPQSHEGHSGYTIDQMKPFVMSDMQYNPNIILLHIGTNDTYGSSPSGAPMRLANLVDMLLSTYPNSLLVVAKIIPYPSQMANVNLINASIPDLVSSRAGMGKHILMVDLNTGFVVSSMLSSDSIHPNQTGYNFMGDTWYSTISSYLH
jgi:hypothetical protein